jgi:CRISPR system Cascade subunit CasE
VSPDRPDFSHIAEQCGWPATSVGETKDYSPVLGRLDAGQTWRFRLKANPARKVLVDQGRDPNPKVVGTIQGCVTMTQQVEWLLGRAESHGFTVASSDEGFSLLTVSQRHTEKYERKGKRVTITTAMYDGILTVSDPDLLRHALCFGIGRAKGFGCGLLTVSPVR